MGAGAVTRRKSKGLSISNHFKWLECKKRNRDLSRKKNIPETGPHGPIKCGKVQIRKGLSMKLETTWKDIGWKK